MLSWRAPSNDVYLIFLSTFGEEMTHARTYNPRRVRVRRLIYTIRTSCAMKNQESALGHTASAKGSAQHGKKRSTQGLPKLIQHGG
jgi:hypothetical protein